MKSWGAFSCLLVCFTEGTGRWGPGWLQSWNILKRSWGVGGRPPVVCSQQGTHPPWGVSGKWGLPSHQAHKKGKLSSLRSEPLPDFSYRDSRYQHSSLMNYNLWTELLRDVTRNLSSLSNKLPWEIESKPVGTSWSVCSSFREGKTASREPSKVSKAGWRCKGGGRENGNVTFKLI